MHLNGFVDVMSKAFLDVVIQPGQQPNERGALHDMLDHFDRIIPRSSLSQQTAAMNPMIFSFTVNLSIFPMFSG